MKEFNTKFEKDMTPDELQLKRAWEDEKEKGRKIRGVLEDVFQAVENATLVVRVVLYGGSVGASWFYLGDKALAVAIAASLTCAHLLIVFLEYVRGKKKELTR